ncbi:unnamed protein product, partial [marine sediment metagenome]
DVARTLSWAFVQHTNVESFQMKISGMDAKGNVIGETVSQAMGWSGETSNAFATVTSVYYVRHVGAGDAGNIIDIGITDVLGLSNTIYATSDVFKIKKNNANVAVVTGDVSAAYDTYDMHTIG